MLRKICEVIYDNEYIFLCVCTSAVVILPIMLCFVIGWTHQILAALN